ncbi:MAG: clan AA aspartic protease [Calditrichota bacterium]
MGTTYTEVTLRSFENGHKSYTDRFLVDTGAIDCVAPASELERIGVKRIGRRDYELADNRRVALDYGLVQIEVMGVITAGVVVFGPEGAEPIMGVTALESAVLKVNPVTQKLERLPASLLK